MASKDIIVMRKFDFTHDDGTVTTFKPGVHRNVDALVADHWFVRAHLQEDPEEEAVVEQAQPVQNTGRRNR